jgi:Restriction endonuclease
MLRWWDGQQWTPQWTKQPGHQDTLDAQLKRLARSTSQTTSELVSRWRQRRADTKQARSDKRAAQEVDTDTPAHPELQVPVENNGGGDDDTGGAGVRAHPDPASDRASVLSPPGGTGPNRTLEEAALLEALSIDTWQAAERFVAAYLAQMGFIGARVTASGPDAGIDVVAPGLAAQVKHWIGPVGRREIQQLRGATVEPTVVFFALSGYTRQAIEFARDRDIALFRYSSTGKVSPASPRARRLQVESAQAVGERPATAEAAALMRLVRVESQIVQAEGRLRVLRGQTGRGSRRQTARLGRAIADAKSALERAQSTGPTKGWEARATRKRIEEAAQSAARLSAGS